MMSAARVSWLSPELLLLAGLTAVLVITGVTIGPDVPAVYFAVAIPVLIAFVWRQPVWAFAGLLGIVLVSDQYGGLLAGDIEPFMLDVLPLFENLEDFTPLSFAYTNIVELWLLLLVAVWFLRGALQGGLRLKPIVCPLAWSLAAITIALTFSFGIANGGDVKTALWEVRALGYLFILSWLLPQLLERRRDLRLILWVMTLGLGAKAVQGFYRYFVILGMQLDLEETFLAHEDPVMFIPLFFLLAMLLHYRAAAPRLTRALLVVTPLMLAALVLTQRRVAYITLPLCAVFFLLQLSAAPRRTFLRFLVPIGMLGALYVLVFSGSPSPLGRPIDRALQLFDTDNTSNAYRVVEQENLRYTIRRHPWGLGFGHPFEIMHDLPKVWVFWDYIPHNEILWIWVKAGTAGFILVMFFFARVIAESTWAHHRLRDPLLRAVAPIIGLTIINQLVASYYDLQLTFGRNMIYVGTLIGLLAPIERWGGLVGGRSLGRRRVISGRMVATGRDRSAA
jgi:O-antigen ligase